MMKFPHSTLTRRSAALFALAAAATISTAVAEDVKDAGWQPMFNGTSTEGWEGDERLWRVEDGVLIGETDGEARHIPRNSFLIWSGGEPADFELEFRARITGNNNSGVQYRSSRPNAEDFRIIGYQFDLHPRQEYNAMLYEEGGRGIACLRGQEVKLTRTPEVVRTIEIDEVDLGEWNHYRIVARGFTCEHHVNGKLAAVIHDVDEARRAAKGLIALQLHAGPPMKAEFKDIRWRPIEAKPADGAETDAKP